MTPINALRAIQIAEVHMFNPGRSGGKSAECCVSDAHACYERGLYECAHERALKSLAYSLSRFSPVYTDVTNFATKES